MGTAGTTMGGLACALAIACGGGSPPAPIEHAPASSRERVDDCLTAADALAAQDAAVVRALCSELRAHDVPGASLAIAIDGVPVLHFATGVRCLGGAARVTPDTAFRIGSLSKAITAATAAALAERGVVALDDPLPGDLAGIVGAPAGFAPSLRQLLDHTAGIPDVLPSEPLRGRPRAEQVHALLGVPFAAPGRTWSYANGGYALAGTWLAARAGAPWAQLVTDEVLVPLHMDHAYARPPDPALTDVACGHLREGTRMIPFDVVTDYDRFAHGVEAAAPAGAIVASADDLLRFALALTDRPRAPTPPWAKPVLAWMRDTAVLTDRRADERYAAGIVVERLPGGDSLLRHAGATGDFAAELAWVPERGLAIAVVSNAGAPLRATLAAALVRGGLDPRREPAAALPLERYAGRYLAGNAELHVRVEAASLRIDAAAQGLRDAVLTHVDHHRFTADDVELAFVVRDGRVLALRGPSWLAEREH